MSCTEPFCHDGPENGLPEIDLAPIPPADSAPVRPAVFALSYRSLIVLNGLLWLDPTVWSMSKPERPRCSVRALAVARRFGGTK